MSLQRQLGEDRRALHRHARLRIDRERLTAAALALDELRAVAVRPEERVRLRLERGDARRLVVAEHHRARTVAEENAARPVRPVENARQRLGPDYERLLLRVEVDEAARLLERVDKARAGRLQVERARVDATEHALYDAGRGRERVVVGRRGREHDEADLLGLHARRLHRRTRRLRGHRRRRLPLFRHMARMNARMRVNPLVRRLQRLSDVLVGHHFRRKITART